MRSVSKMGAAAVHARGNVEQPAHCTTSRRRRRSRNPPPTSQSLLLKLVDDVAVGRLTSPTSHRPASRCSPCTRRLGTRWTRPPPEGCAGRSATIATIGCRPYRNAISWDVRKQAIIEVKLRGLSSVSAPPLARYPRPRRRHSSTRRTGHARISSENHGESRAKSASDMRDAPQRRRGLHDLRSCRSAEAKPRRAIGAACGGERLAALFSTTRCAKKSHLFRVPKNLTTRGATLRAIVVVEIYPPHSACLWTRGRLRGHRRAARINNPCGKAGSFGIRPNGPARKDA